MTRSFATGLRRSVVAVLLLCPFLGAGRSALAQGNGDDGPAPSNVPAEARALIVLVRSYPPGRTIPQLGSGVFLGADAGSVYLGTAAHVVAGADPDGLWVTFESSPVDSVQATVVQESQDIGAIDFAVIRVPRADAAAQGFAPPLDRVGDARGLRPDDPVSPVGCPDGDCWKAPSPPDRVLLATRLEILFQTTWVKRGSSGGGLFNGDWEVIGIVTDSDPPRARAIPIDQAIAQARVWQVPVDVGPPAIPRAGYRTTVGIDVLGYTGGAEIVSFDGTVSLADQAESGVSGRLSARRRASGFLSPHLSAMLLQPDNLQAISGMAGLGLDLKRGRFTLRPFAEAGVAYVKARYDAGGPGGGNSYIPLWETESKTGLGLGGGATVEVIVAPRIIVSAVGAIWAFDKPEDAPKLPGFWFGGGVRWGL